MARMLALDCKYYRGDRPCEFKQRCRCAHYEPMGHRTLIIKLGALGDVVRTLCLLDTLKEQHPQSHITWLTSASAAEMIRNHPLIDRVMVFDASSVVALMQQRFDLVLSLDKEPGPAGLCSAIKCDDKRGMMLSEWGTVRPCTDASADYFELGLDDDLKFHRNWKSYPQLIHEALGFPYTRRAYRLYVDDAAAKRARSRFSAWRVDGRKAIVALNTGCGSVFANKALSRSRWVEVATMLTDLGYSVVLLGGVREAEQNAWIAEQSGDNVHDATSSGSVDKFVAMVDQCDAMVTGDTLGLHVAVARCVPVVALFGPTCEQEIDLFDCGEKIVSACECGPCYKRTCSVAPNCMEMIHAKDIVTKVESLCGSRELDDSVREATRTYFGKDAVSIDAVADLS